MDSVKPSLHLPTAVKSQAVQQRNTQPKVKVSKVKSRPWSTENKKPTKEDIDKPLLKTANSQQSHQAEKRKLSEDDDEEPLFCRNLIPLL